MNKFFGFVVSIVGVVVAFVAFISLMVALDWGGSLYGLAKYGYFAPRYANVERKVFEGTHSYNQGMVQEFENMQQQYIITTDPTAKRLLGDTILQRASEYPNEDQLPPNLQNFLNNVRKDRGFAQN